MLAIKHPYTNNYPKKLLSSLLVLTHFIKDFVTEQVASNKSSSLPKIILQNTQPLHICTNINKIEIIYKSNSVVKLEGLGGETC
jgi:hypothetical protein